MKLYYNEFAVDAAAWLRELFTVNLLPHGDIDLRSIVDVRPSDLSGYTSCHFFAGIGGWEFALQLAGWPADRPVWTGSCPCQPYSSAGKRKGDADERNLWPDFFRLIRECRPPVIFGEQVASADVVGTELEASFIAAVRRGDNRTANRLAERIAKRCAGERLEDLTPRWVDGIRADLEREGYAFRFAILGAHSTGAPHIRQRLFWVANRDGERFRLGRDGGTGERAADVPQRLLPAGVCLADTSSERCDGGTREERRQAVKRTPSSRSGKDGGTSRGVEHPASNGRGERWSEPERGSAAGGCGEGPNGGFWADSILIPCRDGKYRRIPAQPGLFPLAHGFPNRVGALRGAGNAIVPQVAAAFIKAFLETETC